MHVGQKMSADSYIKPGPRHNEYHSVVSSSVLSQLQLIIKRKPIPTTIMKCFAVLLIVAIASVALAVANPIDVESIEPTKTKATDAVGSEASEAEPSSVRDKRTLLFGAAPYVAAAPVAYSAYTAPLAYSAYSAPYTSYPVAYSGYSAYSAYPYYSSSYYVV